MLQSVLFKIGLFDILSVLYYYPAVIYVFLLNCPFVYVLNNQHDKIILLSTCINALMSVNIYVVV